MESSDADPGAGFLWLIQEDNALPIRSTNQEEPGGNIIPIDVLDKEKEQKGLTWGTYET